MTETYVPSSNGVHPIFESPYAPHKQYPIITAEYALQKRPPVEWTVAGLFQPSSLGMIVGAFGIGKTYALLDLAVCVARGDKWLGKETTQATTLVIDEESGQRRISDRMGMALRGHDANGETPIFAYSFAGFNLMDDIGVTEMAAGIEHIGAKLVVIDALADLIPGADENSVKEVLPALKILREIAESTGACIILLHHTGKSGDYRGSTAIAAKVDVMLKMEREKDSELVKFTFTKARDVEETDLGARMNFEGDRFWLSPAAAMDREPHYSRSQKYVLAYLADHPNSPLDEIMSNADSCSEQAARQAVFSLAGLKKVKRTDAGKATQKATYGLVISQNGSSIPASSFDGTSN